MSSLRGMLEMKAVANEIAGLLLQATAAGTAAQGEALKLRFKSRAALLTKATEHLPRNDASQAAAAFAAQLVGLGSGAGGAFALRGGELALDQAIA